MEYKMPTRDEILEQRDALFDEGKLTTEDGSLTYEAIKLDVLYKKNDELEEKAKQLKAMFKDLSTPEAERLFEYLFNDHRTYQQMLFAKIIWAGVKVYAQGADDERTYDLRNEASKAAALKAWKMHDFYFPFI